MELSLTRKAPMRLKDYLVDELSSCSSNGFRSYPRRRQQCCTTTTTTIRLIDVQLHLKNPTLKTPSSKSSSISAFQRASNALINAVKLLHLPFASSGAASTLPRKFIKRCFSKKKTDNNNNNNNNNVEIPIGINAVVDEKSSSPELSFTTGISSISTESNGESYSWSSGSDFTTSDHEYLQCSRVNYEVKKLNKKPKPRSVKINGIVGDEDSVVATSDTSTSSSTSSSKPKPLQTEGEKEHFSPVSVLDRPFEDDEDEDEVSSPFQPRLARSKGSKKRLVKKTQKLEGITKVEPINLEKCIALSESDDQESGSEKRIECKAKDEENNAERKAFELLQLMRGTIFPSSPMNVEEKLLLEFFREGIEIGLLRTPMGGVNGFDNELLLNTAVDWMKGQPQELVPQKSDVKKNTESCLRDIETESDWRKWDEEKKELLFQLEAEVFASLMNEVLHDDLWRK